MNRGFLAGVAWGAVVAGLGLAVISQVAPRPLPPGVEVVVTDRSTGARDDAQAPAGAQLPAIAPDAEVEVAEGPEAAPEAEVPEAVPEPMPDAEAPDAEVPAAEVPAAELPDVEVPETAVTGAAAPADTPQAPPAAPPDAGGVVVASQPPSGPQAADSAARPAMPVPTAPSVQNPDTPAGLALGPLPAAAPRVAADVPPPAPDEVLLVPAPPPAGATAAAPAPSGVATAPDPVPGTPPLPQTAPPAPDAAPALPVARPLPLPETVAEPAPPVAAPPAPVLQPVRPIIAEDTPRRLVPDPGLPGAAGVRVGQLPSIGAPEIPSGPPALPATDPPATDPPANDPPAADATETDPPPEDAPPVQRFARAFDNPDGKPLFAILLRDTGAADLDRAALARISFPVTFVIDPMQPGAAAAAEIYRGAGHEVLMLASGIPEGATPGDLEQTFQSLGGILPEAVGVMDQPDGGFQGNRPLAAQVVPILQAEGRGLVTFDVGLNAADQEARRAALPSAMIFRRLDAEGEEAPVIRRYLDRAAFKAAQEGRVVVLGDTRPETVAALLEWAVEGRAASVALAPVTAVMAAP